MPSGQNRLIWADLFIPDQTPAGDYQATVTITSDQGTQELTLESGDTSAWSSSP